MLISAPSRHEAWADVVAGAAVLQGCRPGGQGAIVGLRVVDIARVVVAEGAVVGTVGSPVAEEVEIASSSWAEGLRWVGPPLSFSRVFVEAHVADVQKVKVVSFIEGLHVSEVLQGVDRPDMVQNNIKNKAHTVPVGLLDQFLQIFLRAEVCIYLIQVLSPVSVVAVATLFRGRAIEVLDHRGDPDAVEAHTADVI